MNSQRTDEVNWTYQQCLKHFSEAESYLCSKCCSSALQFCKSHKTEDEHLWICKKNDDVLINRYHTQESTLTFSSHLIKKVTIDWIKLWCIWSENADNHWKHELLKTLSRRDLTWNKNNQQSCKSSTLHDNNQALLQTDEVSQQIYCIQLQDLLSKESKQLCQWFIKKTWLWERYWCRWEKVHSWFNIHEKTLEKSLKSINVNAHHLHSTVQDSEHQKSRENSHQIIQKDH